MSRPLLPLDLFGELTTASGTKYKWNANEPPDRRLRNLSFSTKIGEGFSSATGTLARRIDLDYPDLNLVDSLTLTGADGSTAWEGRLSAIPRQLGDSHSIGVTFTGWMAHAKDRKFQEIYVDRDLGAWSEMTTRRRAALLASNWTYTNGPTVSASPDDNLSGVELGWTGGWTTPFKPTAEAHYYGGGIPLGQVAGSVAVGVGASTGDTNFSWDVHLATDDLMGTQTATANLRATTPTLFSLTANRTDYTRAALVMVYNATAGGGDGITYMTRWTNMAVYGNHRLPLYVGETGQPSGVLASDVVRDIAARFCPMLNTSGVQDTSYVIQHLTFKDPVFPYDAFLEINKYHLWQLAVWENRTLTFKEYELRDYDWEIRIDDPGTTFEPQGPSIDDVFNGIAVSYTDALKGTKNRLTPDEFPADLMTSDPLNPWNMHGVNHWDEIELSTPTTQAQALQLGRAALADRNTAKTPGTITVSNYVRDRAGNMQPVWKVRAGDTVAVTNFPNSRPRLIVETSYDDEGKKNSLSIDRPFALLDAYLDRVNTALGARGLG